MKTKTNKQLKNACLFAFVALWSICGARAQSPGPLWAGGNTASYPQYLVYGKGPDAGYHQKPMGTDVVIPETIWYVNGATSNAADGITDFNFRGPYTVTRIYLSPLDEDKASVRSISYPSTVTTIDLMADFRNLQSIDILPSVTAIGNGAFGNDSSLVSVTIPATVTSIGQIVFGNCTSLQSVVILNSTIGPDQFSNCLSLKDVTISDNVTTIGTSAFYNCPSMETLTVPASVTGFGMNALQGMQGLKTLHFHAKTIPGFNFLEQGIFYGLPVDNLDLTGVETIGQSSCGGLVQLKNLILPESVKTIDVAAFSGNQALESITIPATVTSIGSNVFQNCTALQSATILNSDIGSYQFSGCSSLKDIILSESVKTIGSYAFGSIVVGGDNQALESITIPASVTSIGTNVFQHCTALQSATILNNRISNTMFAGCTSLKSVTISDNVTFIGSSAFSDCTNLQDVTVNWQTPLSVASNPFSGVYTKGVTLHVPAGTTALYQAAPVWKDFYIVEDVTPTAIKTVDNASFHVCFINNALRIESPHAELINIYSITGSLLYSGKKNEGAFEIPFSPIQEVYIIKGSVSGTIKVVK